MTIEVQYAYSGIYIETSDQAVNLHNTVVDTDPSDSPFLWGVPVVDWPASILYFLNGNDLIYLSGNFNDDVYAGSGDDEPHTGGGDCA